VGGGGGGGGVSVGWRRSEKQIPVTLCKSEAAPDSHVTPASL